MIFLSCELGRTSCEYGLGVVLQIERVQDIYYHVYHKKGNMFT